MQVRQLDGNNTGTSDRYRLTHHSYCPAVSWPRAKPSCPGEYRSLLKAVKAAQTRCDCKRLIEIIMYSGRKIEIKLKFFATPAAFRRWLVQHHTTTREFWVGFHKKATRKPSITWPEAVDQLLCFGWIDGVRKSVDSGSYAIRITPRRQGSIWSTVNTRRAEELLRCGLMRAAGAKAFRERDVKKSAQYSFEHQPVELTPAQREQFRANHPAWEYFRSQPPGYRKTATFWVVSAKQRTTQQRRLSTLIADSAAGRRIAQLRRGKDATR